MISIPLFVFLVIFAIVVLASVTLWCINVYHIIASASMTPAAFFVSATVAILGILVIGGTWLLVSDVDWSTNLPIFDSNPLTQDSLSYDRP